MLLDKELLKNKNVNIPGFSAPKAPKTAKPKVLIIEDDRTIRRLAREKISDHCKLIMAANGSLGATRFKYERPDIVFIDSNLPDTNGRSLLEWMMQINPKTFAVMFSDYDTTRNIKEYIEAGAKGFISKPLDIKKMIFFINQCQLDK
jgi:two-component system chemotaxis response regulator CheY